MRKVEKWYGKEQLKVASKWSMASQQSVDGEGKGVGKPL
jgi:hypothetical protein